MNVAKPLFQEGDADYDYVATMSEDVDLSALCILHIYTLKSKTTRWPFHYVYLWFS